MHSLIQYTRPDGQSVSAYLAEPEQGSGRPGVVVIQEWWGLDNQIKSRG
jgi:carboxymethylenebutenolidase